MYTPPDSTLMCVHHLLCIISLASGVSKASLHPPNPHPCLLTAATHVATLGLGIAVCQKHHLPGVDASLMSTYEVGAQGASGTCHSLQLFLWSVSRARATPGRYAYTLDTLFQSVAHGLCLNCSYEHLFRSWCMLVLSSLMMKVF